MKAKDGQFFYFPWLAQDRNWLRGGSHWPVECLDIIENRVLTWRIIPASKWLGSPPFTSHLYRPFARGTHPVFFGPTISPYYITTKNQFLGADPPSTCWIRLFQHLFFLGREGPEGGRRKIPLLKEWFPSVRLFSRWKPGFFSQPKLSRYRFFFGDPKSTLENLAKLVRFVCFFQHLPTLKGYR